MQIERMGRIFRRSMLVVVVVMAALVPRAVHSQQVLDQAYINVPFEAQNTQVWCWVAAARMVALYYNVNVPSQCEMLQAQYGAPCCGNPAQCMRPGHITEIQTLIASFGLRYSALGGAPDGWTLLALFKQGQPVVLYVNDSHFVVASGIRVVASPYGPIGYVRVLDPYFGIYEEAVPALFARTGGAIYVF